ncbi:hypothetical protein [Streptomyces agglomeratus]|uniref:hypothetical protein n=1 Tax=Streptomyces agglomeratus TaxID=285458 RepID=UPI00114CE765|nr:hypothetical protein [Streptomyces agglomeratus]
MARPGTPLSRIPPSARRTGDGEPAPPIFTRPDTCPSWARPDKDEMKIQQELWLRSGEFSGQGTPS